MKKYFVTSDLHSFFHPFIDALTNAGFDYDNPDHILIICGDLFDRGSETMLLYQWIKSLPKERRILIRGNHEYLLRDLLKKDYPEEHDFFNGTVKTCCAFANYNYENFKMNHCFRYLKGVDQFEKWSKIKNSRKLKSIVKWIFKSGEWVDYFELDRYIFVHSFIPLETDSILPVYYLKSKDYTYKDDWRTTSSDLYWEDASWGCPWELYKGGLFNKEIENNKCLVVGHWQTSDFHYNLSDVKDENQHNNFEIYYSKNLIALDACTALTHKVNVFVIEK